MIADDNRIRNSLRDRIRFATPDEIEIVDTVLDQLEQLRTRAGRIDLADAWDAWARDRVIEMVAMLGDARHNKRIPRVLHRL